MTVREMIQMLVLNCDLNDKVEIEYKEETDNTIIYRQIEPKHIFHMSSEGGAIIECHED